MATQQVNCELERQGVFARGNAMTAMSWRAAMCQDGVAVRRIRLWGELDIPGIEESPHLFEAPPITTTANIIIDDSCDRDGCKSMACRNTQWMTEVAANHSLIVSQRDGSALLEGMLNWVISWMGEGRLVMG
ncbi:hypothetical protein BU17DRAFT_67682 [Hysterangium stoloniferum]|nr:hypothetical protein BU17DRAFT_67682 [Hysterangium stoloniferum]